MPVQWNGPLTSPQQLAAIIQGEAGSNPAAQFAVASTMYNRVQDGGFGSGITSVVTPTQFNGFNANPNSNAQSLANALWNGDAPPGGSTGNALYFAANSHADATSASTNNFISSITGSGTNIGGNYFSDQFGAPSANFQAPQYGGASDNSVASTSGVSDAAGIAQSSSFLNTPLSQMGLGALGLGGVAATGSKLVSSLASGVGLGGGANPVGQDTGTGTPIVITDATSVGSKGASDLGKNIASTGDKADQTITQNTSLLSKTLTGLWQYAGNIGFDFVPRIGVGTAAIVLLLMGIWLMGKQGGKA